MLLLSPMHEFSGRDILVMFGPHLRQYSGAALERTMSLTQLRDGGSTSRVRPVTAQSLLEKKRSGQAITALTAYDYPTARLVDQAGIDIVLVGDSVGMAVLGYDSTLPVTMDEMLHHTRAVARGVQRAFLVADMPFGSYHASGSEAVRNATRLIEEAGAQEMLHHTRAVGRGVHRAFLVADMPFGSYHASGSEAVRNATRLIKEAGAQAVKIEGGQRRAALVQRMTDAEISVVAHIGLTPQSVHRMSGYRVQGRTSDAIAELYADAIALKAGGAS